MKVLKLKLNVCILNSKYVDKIKLVKCPPHKVPNILRPIPLHQIQIHISTQIQIHIPRQIQYIHDISKTIFKNLMKLLEYWLLPESWVWIWFRNSVWYLFFLAVPWHLCRFPCDWLTDSNTLLKNTTIEHSERLVTLETCYQNDKMTWPDQQTSQELRMLSPSLFIQGPQCKC